MSRGADERRARGGEGGPAPSVGGREAAAPEEVGDEARAGLPLRGARVGVTRSREQAGEIVDLLRASGGEPVLVPCLEIADPVSFAPLDEALDSLPGGYDGVLFSSPNAVRRALARPGAARMGEVLLAATGTATAEALAEHGLAAGVVPSRFRAEGLVDALVLRFGPGGLAGTRWLLPRADLARDVLPASLRSLGATVDEVIAYRNLAPESAVGLEALVAGLDAITFASGSAVARLREALAESWEIAMDGVVVASIGPVTSAACRGAGLSVAVEAAEARIASLVDALAASWGRRG